MTQYFVIAAIVLWALLYSAWSLMPAGARRAVAQRVGAWAAHLGLGQKLARGLQATLARPGNCSACSNCSGCGKSAAPVRPETHVFSVERQPRSH